MTKLAYYQSQALQFGIPLDNRHTYQKTDLLSWMGALAFDNSTQQDRIIDFLYDFANTSSSREPLTDLYDCATNKVAASYFIAKAVMGGMYAVLTNAGHRQAVNGVMTGLEGIADVIAKAPAEQQRRVHAGGQTRGE